MDKVLKSEVSIQPINNNVLVKKVIKDYPILAIGNNKRPDIIGEVKYYIAGSSVEGFYLGQEIIVDDAILNKGLNIKENKQSYTELNKFYHNLSNKEMESAMQESRVVDTIDYFIVHHMSIDGIVIK